MREVIYIKRGFIDIGDEFVLCVFVQNRKEFSTFKAVCNLPLFMRAGDIFCVILLIFLRQNVAKVALQTAFKPKYNARFEPSFAREPLVCHFDKFVAIFIQIRDFFSYKFATF